MGLKEHNESSKGNEYIIEVVSNGYLLSYRRSYSQVRCIYRTFTEVTKALASLMYLTDIGDSEYLKIIIDKPGGPNETPAE